MKSFPIVLAMIVLSFWLLLYDYESQAYQEMRKELRDIGATLDRLEK